MFSIHNNSVIAHLSNARLINRARRISKAFSVLALCIVFAAPMAAFAGNVILPGSVTVSASSGASGTFDLVAPNPQIEEGVIGEWSNPTTFTITAPPNFAFDTSQDVSAAIISPADTFAFNGANPSFATPTASTITFPNLVAVAATAFKAQIQFNNIRLRATSCPPAVNPGDTAQVTIAHSSVPFAPSNVLVNISVSALNGPLHHFGVSASSATAQIGTPIIITLTAFDQCNNPISGFNFGGGVGSITLTATGDAGIRTFGNGALPGNFTLTDPLPLDNTALINFPGNAFDANGKGTFTVSRADFDNPGPTTITVVSGAANGNTNVQWENAACTLTPPTSTNQINASHTVTFTVTKNGAAVGAGVPITFQIVSGPNAGAVLPGLTNGAGVATLTYNGVGGTGTDNITATATVDGILTTCTATKTWINAACSLSPPTSTNQIGTNHTVTLSVTKNGVPVPAGVPVTFQITAGPNVSAVVPTVTVAGGTASFTYPGTGGIGIDTITSTATVDGVLTTCTASKTWSNVQCSFPAAQTHQVGTTQSVTVTVSENGVGIAAGTSVLFEVIGGGPNNGKFGVILTGVGGTATFSYTDTGSPNGGTDTIKASGVTPSGIPFTCTTTLIWINPSCSLSPAAQTRLVNTSHSVTATVLRTPGNPVPMGTSVTFLVTAGPNAGQTATVPTSDGLGHADFTYTSNGITGSDDIQTSGIVDTVPFLCNTPANVTWIDTGCALDPPAGVHQIGTTQGVTVTVLKNGAPSVGILVTFNVTAGPNAGQSNALLTNVAGKATFSYTSNGIAGTDSISASGTVSAVPFTCTATKEWVQVGCSLTPPAAVNLVGTLHTVTVQLSRNPSLPGALGPGLNVNFEVTGVNGPLTGSSPTNASGLATFSYLSNGLVGLDTITATGNVSGVPFVCTSTKEWITASCTLTPPTSSGPVSSPHIVTAQIIKNGAAVGAGIPVTFQVTAGPNAGGPVIVPTNIAGQAVFNYNGGATPGTDTITSNATVNGVLTTCTATRDWVAAGCSLSPPTATNPVGANHSVTISVSRNGLPAPAGVMVHFAIVGGLSPNAGKQADVLTGVGGTATFTYLGNGGVGTDTIQATGVVDGAPFNCTASKIWITTGCSLDPQTDTNQIGANHTVTATLLKNGAPVSGILVNFLVIGAGSPNSGKNGSATTNALGQAAFTYAGTGGIGVDTIQSSGTIDGVPVSCTATKTWINAGCALAPPTDTNQVGGSHTVTVTVTSNAVPQGGILTTFDIISGPNTGQSGVFFTNGSGNAAFIYNSNGTAGIDTIRATGSVTGVPFLCTATKEWINAGCSLAPASDTNQVGTSHTVTLTVTKNGVAQSGVSVNFSVSAGPNAGQAAVHVTNGLGQATFTYTGSLTPGTDTISASGTISGVPFNCSATKEWINAGCSIAPATETVIVNTPHNTTVTVQKNGAAAPGVAVVFNVTAGPNSGKTGNGVTDAAGQAIFTYTGGATPGTDTITATGVVNGVPFNCQSSKIWILDDNDGQPPDEEDGGPNNGDGNGDGIPDSLQPNVTTFKDIFGHYITIESPAGTTLVNVRALNIPAPDISPPGVTFPFGFFAFEVHGVPVGGSVNVRVFLHGGPTVNTYYKFGATPIIPVDHYYRFLFDGVTGSEIAADIITLHLTDGQRGDDDIIANGIIVEPGAPALEADNPAPLTATPACGACGSSSVSMMPAMLLGMFLLRRARSRRRA